jgi:hypothetical protein
MRLHGVGDVYGRRPKREAITWRRSMWNGSLTRTTRRCPFALRMRATLRSDALVVRPFVSIRIALSGTPFRSA